MPPFNWSDGGSQFIMVEGLQLEAACFGPPPEQAPTLVLLHEGLGCVALWRDFPEKLATRYRKRGLCGIPVPAMVSPRPVFPARDHWTI